MGIADESAPVLLRCSTFSRSQARASHSDVEEFLHAEITLREQTSTETNKCLLNIKICIINIEA